MGTVRYSHHKEKRTIVFNPQPKHRTSRVSVSTIQVRSNVGSLAPLLPQVIFSFKTHVSEAHESEFERVPAVRGQRRSFALRFFLFQIRVFSDLVGRPRCRGSIASSSVFIQRQRWRGQS